MIIGFDAKRAFHNKTGLGNYSRTIIKNLIEFHPNNSYLLYTPKHESLYLHRELKRNNNLKLCSPNNLLPKKLSSIWRSWWIPKTFKDQKVQLYHGLSNELPNNIKNSPTPCIVSIHDLIFLKHPEWYPKVDVHFYRKKFKYACENSDHIIAISQQTKSDIIEYYKINDEKISVVYQSCDPIFYDLKNVAYRNEIVKKYGLDNPFFFYVGSLNERKNVVGLVESFGKIAESCGFNLFIAGDGGKQYKEKLFKKIAELKLEERVSVFHNIPNDDLPALYQLADIFVFPSSYEAFGIPIIEALNSKTPVITSEGSCFAETAGPGAIYVKAGDINLLAEKMLGLSQNKQEQKTLGQKGHTYVQMFRREKTTKELMGIYKKLI